MRPEALEIRPERVSAPRVLGAFPGHLIVAALVVSLLVAASRTA